LFQAGRPALIALRSIGLSPEGLNAAVGAQRREKPKMGERFKDRFPDHQRPS